MTSRQSRLRERRKAEGSRRIDLMLSAAGASALVALKHGNWRDKTDSELVEASLLKAALDAGLLKT